MRMPGWIVLGIVLGVIIGYLAPILYSMIIVREDNPQIGLVSVFFGVPTGAVIGGIVGTILSVAFGSGPTESDRAERGSSGVAMA